MNKTLIRAFWLAAIMVAAASTHAADDAEINLGRYLATAGDCIACHSAPGGKPMAGGLALSSPLGSIYSTNITPSKTHGIGNYTLAQFSDALRHGKRADGAYLYPAMPYTSYAKLSDKDIAALYAYFMQGVTPVDTAAPATDLPFPFNIRMSMGVWNLIFHDATPYQEEPSQSQEWNRGAYLSQGLAHCSTCHTPRNTLMAEDHSRSLAGAVIGGWDAPNITSDAKSGIGDWSEAELIAYMSGHPVPGRGPASGPMAEAIDFSLKHLTPEDLKAIAVYIKSVPAVATPGVAQPADSFGKQTDHLDTIRGVELPKDLDAMTGAQIYDGYCASCHQAQGQGSDGDTLPALTHNTTLGHHSTNNLVMVMLHGIHRHDADSVMPGFAHELSDKQLATLGNFLLTTYGNPDAKVTEQQVAALRDPAKAGMDTSLVTLARIGMALGGLVVLAIIIWLLRCRRPRRKQAS